MKVSKRLIISLVCLLLISTLVSCGQPSQSTMTDRDTDGDGWSDAQELKAGTDYQNVDTDGDGYWDSKDANPLDSKISGDVSGLEKSERTRTAPTPTPAPAPAPTPTPTPAPTPIESNLETIKERLVKELSGDVNKFRLINIDVAGLSKDLESGVARLSLVNNKGQTVTLKLSAQRIQLREPGLISGFLKAGKPENPSIEKVKLPPEQNFRLGETGQEVLDKDRANCGALTIMDEAQTMISGMVIGPSVGVTFFEPVDLILGGRSYPGLHILYNIMDTVPVAFPDEEQPSQVEPPRKAQDIGKIPQQLPQAARLGKIDPADYAIFKQTKIVLDGDVQFYEFDESTVWSRQEAIHNNVALVYEVIEPLSGGWGLHIPIKGQEVWISGGPPKTGGQCYVSSDLMNELVDPDYLLINQVEEDELHLFLVDYRVAKDDRSGYIGGRAAGIGNSRGGIGGGAGRNHAFMQVAAYNSFKYKWIIMTHEIGHLLGAMHRYAESDHTGCAGGFYEFLCGPSIMKTSVAQADRAPYFSGANDFLIWITIDSTLSDWP